MSPGKSHCFPEHAQTKLSQPNFSGRHSDRTAVGKNGKSSDRQTQQHRRDEKKQNFTVYFGSFIYCKHTTV